MNKKKVTIEKALGQELVIWSVAEEWGFDVGVDVLDRAMTQN